MPDLMVRALFTNLTSSPHQISLDRCKFLKKWTTIAQALEPQENQLHALMPVHVRGVMQGKRILLMRELASELNWPDKFIR